jgi:hypothetical protein
MILLDSIDAFAVVISNVNDLDPVPILESGAKRRVVI